jgi:hypothetical protein
MFLARSESKKKNFFIGVSAGVIVLAMVVVFIGWYTLFRYSPGPYDGPNVSAEEYYKYGSTGSEDTRGIPMYIWLTLPELFPEYLPGPGGLESIGFVYEEGHELPVGIPRVEIGIVPRVGINCATCHHSTFRTSADQTESEFYPAGPPQRFDLQAYTRFLFASARDERFNANVIMAEMENHTDLNFFEKMLYRYLVIPGTKDALVSDAAEFDYEFRNPDTGRGRIDPFNALKFQTLDQPIDETIGHADMMPIWYLNNRVDSALHWDGLNTSVTEVVVSSGIGDGATEKSINLEVLARLEDYFKNLPPPPFPFEIDQQLASEGEVIFDANCSMCHEFGVGRTGGVIPVDEVGTDRNRVDMWQAKDGQAYNDLFADKPWGFKLFRNVDGYVATPLDGLWLTAPYLHNGSVPTLVDLLEPPENRPTVFYRGSDVFDPETMGFLHDAEGEGDLEFFRYDTSVRGNSNQGHLYGTDLSDEDKRALIEYLKTK